MSFERVLIADDDPELCTLFLTALRSEPWTVETAGDGREALDQLCTLPFDVAILDYDMPHFNGLSVLESVRQKGIQTDVVLLTGYALDLTRFGGYLISWEKGDPLCRQHVHLIHLSSKSKWSNWFEPVVRQESWPKSSSPQTRRSGTGWYRPTETRAFEKTV